MNDLDQTVEVSFRDAILEADISVPVAARGAVLFVHGSGSSRHSPRNRYVAEELQNAGLATVLTDLLTPDEARADADTGEFRFDIRLLASRVVGVTDWLVDHDLTAGLGFGLFGASTGAAAALVAAAIRPETVTTVVARGGRPDLAGSALRLVHQPTLFIVGERDPAVIDLNRQAMEQLAGAARLEIVPGASHLFEEPGALEQVARLARDWFVRWIDNEGGSVGRSTGNPEPSVPRPSGGGPGPGRPPRVLPRP
jgi:dienelactone hydrolase